MTVPDVYNAIMVPGALLLIYVIQQASHDQTCVRDRIWIKWARRGSFYATALAGLNSVADAMSQLSMLILIVCALCIVAVNAITLHLRETNDHLDGSAILAKGKAAGTGDDGLLVKSHKKIRVVR
jgi:hypothetical protein